jgi:hypothetical protein
MLGRSSLVLLAVLALVGRSCAADAMPRLKRSNAKRWQNLKEMVQAEISVNTQKFLADRYQVCAGWA